MPLLHCLRPFLITPRAEVAVAVVIDGVGQLSEVPEEFDSPDGEYGGCGDVLSGFGGGTTDQSGDSLGGGIAQAVGLAEWDY